MLFPDPAKLTEGHQAWNGDEGRIHTLAIDPQERALRPPFTKHTALKEPLRCPHELDAACDVVIG